MQNIPLRSSSLQNSTREREREKKEEEKIWGGYTLSVLQYFPSFQKLPPPPSPPALARFSMTISFSLLCKPPPQKCVEKHESAPKIYKASVRKLFGKISMRKTAVKKLLLLVLPRLPLGKKKITGG